MRSLSSHENETGNGASLFLGRISAWLRLTYLVGFAIATQLRALAIFVRASSGTDFLHEFLEGGARLSPKQRFPGCSGLFFDAELLRCCAATPHAARRTRLLAS